MTSPPFRRASPVSSVLGRSRNWKPGGAARWRATSVEERCLDSTTTKTSKSLATIMSAVGTYLFLKKRILRVARRMADEDEDGGREGSERLEAEDGHGRDQGC